MSDNLRGILLMCLAMLAFVINDSFMKAVSQDLPLFQAITLRGIGASAALAVIAYLREGHLRLWPQGPDLGVLTIRTMAEVLATVTFLTALVHMPLATLSAIMQALPLAVTLAAALFYREAIAPQIWLAIAAGFVGVLLIVKPGFAAFDRWSVLGLVSVAFVVLRDLSTRHFSGPLPSTTVAIWAAISVTLLGLVGGLFEDWQSVPLAQALMLAGSTAALVVGYITVVMVMRVGDVAIVAPFRYTALLWALLFGWLFFGSLPDMVALVGAVIVVVSGIVTLTQARHRADEAKG
ncbi:MAG: DMT family transporter [Cypionkella sp.]|nr:DMT family transporter [Cypionkella sp.]